MVITTRKKQGLVHWCYGRAATNGTTLRAEIAGQLQARGNDAITGRAIASTSGDGQSVSFAVGSDPSDMLEVWTELLTMHDQAQAALIATGTSTPTDAAIRDEMLFRLTPATVAHMDYSSLRR